MFRDSLTIAGSWRLLSRLRRRLAWSADRLHDHQWQALQRMIQHAYEQTALYRRLYDAAGVHPEDVRTWEDFARLPTVDKATLRAAFPEAAIARSFAGQPLVRRRTGGSTGEPLEFVLDRAAVAYKIAGNLRSMEIAGYRPGWDRLVQTSPDARFVTGWARWCGDRLLGRRCLDPFRPDWDAACRELRRLRPTVLCGWTMREYGEIRRYQVEQPTRDRVEIRRCWIAR